jgi:bacterioferritin (cytochrome b1)
VPSWEFWRSFAEHVQIFWKILIPLFISLINILTSLTMQYLLYYKLQQNWHRKEQTENKLSQLRLWMQHGKTFNARVEERGGVHARDRR